MFNFTIPRGATGNGIESIYLTGTSGAVKTYTILFTDGNTTTFDVTDGEVTNASLAEVLEDYAKTDGAYESMTVGNAEQLISSVTVNDKVPYNFRTSGGSIDIGNREVDKLVGGTVAWNQLIPIAGSSKTKTRNNVTFTDNRDGSYTVSTTAEGASADTYLTVASGTTARGNHVGLLTGCPSGGDWTKYRLWDAWGGLSNDYGNGSTGKWAAGGQYEIRIQVASGCVITTPVTFYPRLVDLTQLFGSAIADYAYSVLRQTTGQTKAWFRKLFPKPYYAYNAGELMSVKTSAHQMVGFNQLDPAKTKIGGAYNPTVGATINLDSTGATYTGTNPIEINVTSSWCGCCLISEPLVAGQQYEVAFKTSAPTTADKRISQYLIDADNKVITSPYNWVGNSGDNVTRTFTPTESGLRCVVTIQSTSAQKITVTDPCIHLVWDGERDGDYEAYKKWTYPLDSDLELRGIPKLDASNNLYYDGDVYESDGTVTRKWGYYTIQESDVSLDDGGGYTNVVCAKIQNLPDMLKTNTKQAIHSKYGVSQTVWPFDDTSNIGKFANNPATQAYWFIFPVGTTIEQMKTALSGTTVVYELATPTTETADPYTNPQIVDDFGTEEYVDERTVAIPVGHDTEYMNNLKAKLEMAPDSPDGDGDYIVRQTNGENSYVPLMKELPSLPIADGTYTLKCTVTSGTATLGWEREE